MLTRDDITIVVASHGDRSWSELACARAVPSAEAEHVATLHLHCFEDGATLAFARNRALRQVTTSHVVYLDADDEVEPGFVDAMLAGTADLRAPAVRYVKHGGPGFAIAKMPRVAGHGHDCTAECLAFGNWLVVGALVPVELVRRVGGWREWDYYEDWDLWARCWQAGATVEAIPAAVYRAHVRPDSRNRAGAPAERHAVHRSIARDLGLPVPE